MNEPTNIVPPETEALTKEEAASSATAPSEALGKHLPGSNLERRIIRQGTSDQTVEETPADKRLLGAHVRRTLKKEGTDELAL